MRFRYICVVVGEEKKKQKNKKKAANFKEIIIDKNIKTHAMKIHRRKCNNRRRNEIGTNKQT